MIVRRSAALALTLASLAAACGPTASPDELVLLTHDSFAISEAVLDAFEAIGYDDYLTFEYFHPYQHFPEALIHQTADSLDRMLGIK